MNFEEILRVLRDYSSNPIISGVLSTGIYELICKTFHKFYESKNKDFRVRQIDIYESHLDPADIRIELNYNKKYLAKNVNKNGFVTGFAFSELKQLTVESSSKVRSIAQYYSQNDNFENRNRMEGLKNEVFFEKYKEKKRNNKVFYKSQLPLIYCSNDKYRIKNILICVDGGRAGFDLFVLQILQSARYEYTYADQKVQKSKYIALTHKNTEYFETQSRIVRLDQLENMMENFYIPELNLYKTPAVETKYFMEFINAFNRAYYFGNTD